MHVFIATTVSTEKEQCHILLSEGKFPTRLNRVQMKNKDHSHKLSEEHKTRKMLKSRDKL